MVRIKMAKFLQETVGEVALSGIAKQDAAKEFNDFFGRVIFTNPASYDRRTSRNQGCRWNGTQVSR